jgi:Uri superfamily endonuclease
MDRAKLLSGMPLRGTYALFLHLEHDTPIVVGRLGTFHFPAGYYIYVGSALGGGGLSARLARHYRQQKKLHWHIDYLLAHARIVGVRTDASGERLECVWARKWLDTPGVQVIAPGFGASDCGCPAHLIYLGSIQPGPRKMQWNNAQSN